jgi:divalent metal cation (Fe/Co/Zn/Cd) transporter
VLIGLVLMALFGWWWADGILAIAISVLALREARRALTMKSVEPEAPEAPDSAA